MASRLQDGAGKPSDIDCAADGPHCGICQHVAFGPDWERTPHCSHWEERTAIDVGRVCEAFEPVQSARPPD